MRIDHRNGRLADCLDRLAKVPALQPGATHEQYTEAQRNGEWWTQEAVLHVPLGELCEGGLKTIALVGIGPRPPVVPIRKADRFIAQGLEGACEIRKPLLNALLNMRDLIRPGRGYISA